MPKKSPFDVFLRQAQPHKNKGRSKSSRNILPLVHVAFTFFLVFWLEGSHQKFIDKTKAFWWFWLLLYGILQGGPLRQGLPIHLFVIYPHIVRVAFGSQVCSSLAFQIPPYPDSIKCPEVTDEERPHILQIILFLFPELFFWSFGTFLMNFVFFKLYQTIPDRDVAANVEQIQTMLRDRLYYQKLEEWAATYKQYFTLSPYNLVLQDADVTAAIAGLHRFPAQKFINDSFLYSIFAMNVVVTPGIISAACIVLHRFIEPGFVVQSLLSIDASDAMYTPDETVVLSALKLLRDGLYYALAFLWLCRFAKENIKN